MKMEDATIMLVLYCIFLSVLLYGIGRMYNITALLTIQLPQAPESTDAVGIALYNIVAGFALIFSVLQVPFTAYSTLVLIGQQYPVYAMCLMLPAVAFLLVILIGMARLVRGSSG